MPVDKNGAVRVLREIANELECAKKIDRLDYTYDVGWPNRNFFSGGKIIRHPTGEVSIRLVLDAEYRAGVSVCLDRERRAKMARE